MLDLLGCYNWYDMYIGFDSYWDYKNNYVVFFWYFIWGNVKSNLDICV